MNVTLTVKTYVDRKGMLAAVKEASLKPLEEIATRVKNRAKKSMKKGRGEKNKPRPFKWYLSRIPALGPLVSSGDLTYRTIRQVARGLGFDKALMNTLAIYKKEHIRENKERAKRRKQGTSRPGQPPNWQTSLLRDELTAFMDKEKGVAIINTGLAWYGRVHEQGSRKHPKRPFIMPAMLKESQKRPDEFKDLNLSTTKAGRRMNRKKARTAGKRI